ncbi:MAG: sigma-54-dependent Fis family transcriptional regulator [bacterium]|nr:sigma-54-dependent Fis family transcriptional regulator [bacterium]
MSTILSADTDFSKTKFKSMISHPEPAAAVVSVRRSRLSSAEDVVRGLRKLAPQLPVLAVVDTDSPSAVYHLLRLGVDDYVTPPVTETAFLPRIERIAEVCSAVDTETHNQRGLRYGLIGRSDAFLQMVDQLHAFAECDASVLIEGETGTGKGLCARALHELSGRTKGSFCPVNCGALPSELVENELFGHQRSAYTGAQAASIGVIGEAEEGTLFLDEIDSLPLASQGKLLRFAEDHEYRPLGASRVRVANVRLIAATNCDLEDVVTKGGFRRDLYYRLDVLRLIVPPLRERAEDIPLLANYFLKRYALKFGGKSEVLSAEAHRRLLQHDWPGNIRELEHVIQRAVALGAKRRTLCVEHLRIGGNSDSLYTRPFREAKQMVVEDFERTYVMSYLAAHEGNICRAARAAGKNRRVFWELMRKHSIQADEFR